MSLNVLFGLFGGLGSIYYFTGVCVNRLNMINQVRLINSPVLRAYFLEPRPRCRVPFAFHAPPPALSEHSEHPPT